MRNTGILMGLAGVIVCGTAAGCSDGADENKSSALSFTLTGDGSSLELNGAPASRDRHALYPLGGFTKMTVKVSPEGDLTAKCENGRAAIDCPEIPFFAGVKSAGVAFCCPAAMPSAITRTIRSQDRIASSFPGMT